MYLVTGGAGFVGSHLVKALNERGITDVLVVDDLTRGEKFANLRDCVIADYMDKQELRAALARGALAGAVKVVLHQGACTNTLEQDGRYLLDNNFTFSKELLSFALREEVPFVYASTAAVYGLHHASREDPALERPLNAYGWSKLVFDQHVRRILPSIRSGTRSAVVGLRYFNVYGPRERQKGRMASMVHQIWRQLAGSGRARLFEGTDGFGDGEQRRDFVFVDDVVRVNLFFAEGGARSGVFNVGSGRSRSFNDVARTIIGLRGEGDVEYVPFDPALQGKYQSFTEADLTTLRAAGYTAPFTSLEDGVTASVAAWEGWPREASAPPCAVAPVRPPW
jgi:ADP-L-glycero-D-manno-heptose 6-epimerase